jgi:ABC-type bacteriocin/lantibiotic exporter with double-glycine peptidase domain
VRIRNLEYLHGDTYRLVLYFAVEAVDLLKDLVNTLLTLLGLAWALHGNLTVSEVVIFTAVSFGSSLLGNVFRLLQLVDDLKNYDAAVAELRQRQERAAA